MLQLVQDKTDTEDTRWRAVVDCDKGQDGRFLYGVMTTGVYCRPSCKGRTPLRKNVRYFETVREARAAGLRACKRCDPDAVTPGTLAAAEMAFDLDRQGWHVVPGMLTRKQCRALIAGYEDDAQYRSTVTMKRHGFGSGEYRYFAYPLPDPLADLRRELYPLLVPVANGWNQRLGIATRYPAEHETFVETCRAAGQERPTPLILKYGPGDYNCLHQDLYGDVHFPLQIAVLLSDPGEDFEGGEFVMTEQRPRMQSRPHVVPLRRGDGVVFPVQHRPVRGTRGDYRVTLRHGVSEIRRGQRFAAGLIFHDAR